MLLALTVLLLVLEEVADALVLTVETGLEVGYAEALVDAVIFPLRVAETVLLPVLDMLDDIVAVELSRVLDVDVTVMMDEMDVVEVMELEDVGRMPEFEMDALTDGDLESLTVEDGVTDEL